MENNCELTCLGAQAYLSASETGAQGSGALKIKLE